jgi:DNA-binding transcriptional regulator GbsR (MarR family)
VTPPAANPDRALREAQDRFIAVWGQMAGAWGISRTMAEVHALLYVTGEALNTDDVMERLQISRGNASMSLRALVDWHIISKVTRRGDRKEYFEAEQDVWTLFRAIVRERLNREVDPLLANLHEIRDMTARHDGAREKPAAGTSGDDARRIAEHNKRLDEMVEFFEMLAGLSTQFVSPSGKGLRLAASLLTKLPDLPRGKGERLRETGS